MKNIYSDVDTKLITYIIIQCNNLIIKSTYIE